MSDSDKGEAFICDREVMVQRVIPPFLRQIYSASILSGHLSCKEFKYIFKNILRPLLRSPQSPCVILAKEVGYVQLSGGENANISAPGP